MDASEAIRRNARCQLCGSRFTAPQWDVRHSDDDGADIHDTCCELEGPCSRPPAPDEDITQLDVDPDDD